MRRVRAALQAGACRFRPTTAQKRVLGEIVGDMKKDQPMRRLLQGDVGSGKTIVAMQAALWLRLRMGYQTALMAPTEILATQHYLSATQAAGGEGFAAALVSPYRVTLLTGSLDR